jgi:hypothetical protein
MKLLLGIAGLTTFFALLPSPLSPRTFFTTAQTAPAESAPEAQTKRFKIRLTLSSSTDLKVREGDEITKGEVLADRTRDRPPLKPKRDKLNSASPDSNNRSPELSNCAIAKFGKERGWWDIALAIVSA